MTILVFSLFLSIANAIPMDAYHCKITGHFYGDFCSVTCREKKYHTTWQTEPCDEAYKHFKKEKNRVELLYITDKATPKVWGY